MPTSSNVSLSMLKDGAVEELYQQALAQAIASINDPNTEAETKRTITITLDLTPSSDRSFVKADIHVKSKFPAAIPVQTAFLIKPDAQGNFVAHEPIQENLYPRSTN